MGKRPERKFESSWVLIMKEEPVDISACRNVSQVQRWICCLLSRIAHKQGWTAGTSGKFPREKKRSC